VGAFVFCRLPDPEAAAALADTLEQLGAARRYCGAYPWEISGGRFDESQQKARATLWQLGRRAGWNGLFGSSGREIRRQARLLPDLDPEVVRLLSDIASSAPDQWPPMMAAVRERLGAAPKDGCAGMDMQPGVILRQVHASGGAQGAGIVRIGLSADDPRTVGGLGRYLCKAGCALSITAVLPDDDRLRTCLEAEPPWWSG
jgi:hypothetical protein